jgi:hypothetical protein
MAEAAIDEHRVGEVGGGQIGTVETHPLQNTTRQSRPAQLCSIEIDIFEPRHLHAPQVRTPQIRVRRAGCARSASS